MNTRELAGVLIGRFGPAAILGGVILGSVVWSVAQWNAQPGETVSLFWGMIEYTKGSDTSPHGTESDVLTEGAYLMRAAGSGSPLTPDAVTIRVKSSWLTHPDDVVGFCLNRALAKHSLLTTDVVRLC